MRKLAALFALLHMFLLPTAASAQDYGNARVVSTESWVEEWDPVAKRWVRVADSSEAFQPVGTVTTTKIVNGEVVSQITQTMTPNRNAARYAMPVRSQPRASALAHYGPFRVMDRKRAAVHGSTDHNSPAYFDAMLRDFPELEVLELIDAGGTSHDIANMEVGRRIREAGLRTHVPNGGSARSGGVELFLAGETRTMAPGAQFAVHSWLDNYGREPDDFAPDAPENRLYLDYYVEMGMSEDRAANFYAMTNSVPHSGALWLRADDMAPWIAPEAHPERFEAETRYASRMTDDAPISISAAQQPALSIARLEAQFEQLALVDFASMPAPVIPYSDLTQLTLAHLSLNGPRAS